MIQVWIKSKETLCIIIQIYITYFQVYDESLSVLDTSLHLWYSEDTTVEPHSVVGHNDSGPQGKDLGHRGIHHRVLVEPGQLLLGWEPARG